MTDEVLLFSVSTLPVFIIGFFIYKKDANKEPPRLLAKLFFGGIAACFLTIIISAILHQVVPFFGEDSSSLDAIELLVYVFVGVALVEEFSKWIMAYKLSYYDTEFDELYDMIVYCVFVALGFAFFENLFYVYSSGVKIGLLRALSAVPSHACDGFFMGYYLGLSKIYEIRNEVDMKKKYIILSVLVPIVLHGIYDYCLFMGDTIFIVIFFVLLIGVLVYTVVGIHQSSRNNISLKK